MGLNNLIDDDTDETKTKSTETTEDNNTDDSESNIDPGQGVDLDKFEKCCPQCLTISQNKNRRTYECLNDDCGVIAFSAGYFERADIQAMFPSIDWIDLVRKWR